MTGLEILP